MELQTINQVSKQFNISARTLRYYEQIGLIKSAKKDDYSFRTYDEDTILKLRQIIVLRKLRIPLRQIAEILQNENAAIAINAFQQNLSEVEDEITALSTIKSILKSFIERLNITDIKLNLLDDESLLELVDSLTASKINFKEDKTMDDLNKASEKLNKLKDRDVRIVYLPPATVAAIHCIGNDPEGRTTDLLGKFVKTNNLSKIKPDFRHYGFKHPDGTKGDSNSDDHGYESWVTIPEDMEISLPFEKKFFKGGLYAARSILFGEWTEWDLLWDWVNESKTYDFNYGDPECMNGMMEELINVFNQFNLEHFNFDQLHMDLFIPIKEKNLANI